MKKSTEMNLLNNESGSVLVAALMIMVLLTIIGITASRTTNTELMIAENDSRHKRSFFSADGGTEGGVELLKQSIHGENHDNQDGVTIADPPNPFYLNTASGDVKPSKTNKDVTIASLGGSDVYLRIFEDRTEFATGAGLAIAAGYQGMGKGAAGGGGHRIFNIRSLAEGGRNSKARVWLQWRHVI
jgi:Tfp pilus assembly protein PilX